MSLNIKYPSLSSMFTTIPQGGSLVEGRRHRKGAGSMKLSTFSRYHKIDNVRRRVMQRPELPGIPLAEYSYEVTIRTFPLLDSLGSIKRYDSLGFWELSFQEILRHLALSTQYVNSSIWKSLLSTIQSYRDEIIDLLTRYFHDIMNKGDMSMDHFAFYVKEHKNSASPFGMKWSYFLDNPSALKIAHERTNRAIKTFSEEWTKYIRPDMIYINPKYCYPALRARPGEPTILSESNDSVTVLIRKWRDRKAGGIKLFSQLTYPIFQLDVKKDVEKPFYEWFTKILSCEVHPLSQNGPQVYKDLLDYEAIYRLKCIVELDLHLYLMKCL